MLTAIETMGTINTSHQIVLDEELPISEKSRVRIIVLFDENAEDIGESEWLKSASGNDVFELLNDDSEDIYSLDDGKPLRNEV